LSPVPIIAPPVDHMPRLSLSLEASAKVRLERLLEREIRTRETDGLVVLGVRHCVKVGEDSVSSECGNEEIDDDWKVVLGICEPLRRDIIQWILEVGI
jgi:hypothetical protein